MTYRKHLLLAPIVFLFIINCQIYGQSKSKEDLGNTLVESIQSKNMERFKELLLPQNAFLANLISNVPEDIDQEELGSLKTQSETTYKDLFIPQREENFWEIVNLTETNKVNWSNLEFVVLYKHESKDPDYNPFLIHTKLNNSDFHHFYFSAVRYKGEWFLEDKMELTRDEKYAPAD